jgi:hypothetical protein
MTRTQRHKALMCLGHKALTLLLRLAPTVLALPLFLLLLLPLLLLPLNLLPLNLLLPLLPLPLLSPLLRLTTLLCARRWWLCVAASLLHPAVAVEEALLCAHDPQGAACGSRGEQHAEERQGLLLLVMMGAHLLPFLLLLLWAWRLPRHLLQLLALKQLQAYTVGRADG